MDAMVRRVVLKDDLVALTLIKQHLTLAQIVETDAVNIPIVNEILDRHGFRLPD
jgi:hypothetical protein